MKFEFKKRSLEDRAKNLKWKDILKSRRLLAAAESSSSAASAQGYKTIEKISSNYSTVKNLPQSI